MPAVQLLEMDQAKQTRWNYFTRSPRVRGCRGLAASSATWSSVTTALLNFEAEEEWASRCHWRCEEPASQIGGLHRRSERLVTGLGIAITCTHGGFTLRGLSSRCFDCLWFWWTGDHKRSFWRLL